MARRQGRAIDRAYKHNLVVKPIMKPLIAARSNWQDDEVTEETRAIASGLIPETPAASTPEPTATPKPPRKRKPAPAKPVVKFSGKIAWSPQGSVLGWRVEGTEEIEPLSLRPKRKTQEKQT